jgi:WD40 repeat protein
MGYDKAVVMVLLAFAWCVSIASKTVSEAGHSGTRGEYVFTIDSKGIQRTDTLNHVEKTIFSTAGLYAVSMSVAPSDTVVALLITERGVVPPGAHDYSVPPRNRMKFIDSNVRVIAELNEDVRKYSWSPDGEKIASIAGTYQEGGVGFRTTGVWVYDLRDDSKTRIRKDFMGETAQRHVGGGYDINWAEYDGNVYIQDFAYLGGVYRYNPRTGKSKEVDYKGIDFSPDGKYYLAVIPEDGTHLYVSSTNRDISDRVTARIGYLPSSWAGDSSHCLLTKQVSYDNSMLDTVKSDQPGVWEDSRKVNKTTFSVYDVEDDTIVKQWVEVP